MKNILWIILFALLVPQITFSQKPKGKTLNYLYDRLPAQPLEADFKTYSVEIKDVYSKLMNMGMTKTQVVSSYFKLNKYEQLDINGDMEIVVELGRANVVSEDVVTEKKKQGKGDAAKTVNYYRIKVVYNFPILVQLRDGNRVVMKEYLYNEDATYQTDASKLKLSLKKDWEKNRRPELQKAYTAMVKSTFGEISTRLYNEIDERRMKTYPRFFYVKKAEKYKAVQFTDAYETTKKALELSSGETTLEDIKTAAQPAVDTWKEGLEKYDATNKKQVAMYFCSAFNLSQLNRLFGNYGESKKYLELAQESSLKKGAVGELANDLEKSIKRKQANESVEIKYQSAFNTEASAVQVAAAIAIERSYKDFVVTMAKDTIYGDISTERGELGVSKVVIKNENEPSNNKRLGYVDVGEVNKSGVRYRYMQVHESITLNPIGTFELAEEIYGTKKAALLKFKNSEGDYELILRKKGASTNINGIKFLNFNKGLKKFFKECDMVVEKASNKEYKKTESSIFQAINDYTACGASD